jgi:hypothetical protein
LRFQVARRGGVKDEAAHWLQSLLQVKPERPGAGIRL